MRRLVLVLGVLGVSCGGGEPGKTGNASGTAASPTDRSVSQNTEKSVGDASRKSDAERRDVNLTLPAAQARSAGPVPGPVDPAWLRRDLFAGATVKSSGRTPRDADGLFTTQMLFELAEGTTQAACLETVQKELAAAVPELTREDGKDGRVTLRGRNADYAVIAICGEAKGKPTAYVSYNWLKAPAL